MSQREVFKIMTIIQQISITLQEIQIGDSHVKNVKYY